MLQKKKNIPTPALKFIHFKFQYRECLSVPYIMDFFDNLYCILWKDCILYYKMISLYRLYIFFKFNSTCIDCIDNLLVIQIIDTKFDKKALKFVIKVIFKRKKK